MKKIVVIFSLFVALLGADNRWDTVKVSDATLYYVSGVTNGFDTFGFLKIKDQCQDTTMYLSLHNDNDKVKKFNDKFIKVDVTADKTTFTIEVSINVFKHHLAGKYYVYPVVSVYFLMSEKFIKLLKRSKTITFKINPHQKIAKYFKNFKATFDIRGFTKIYTLGYNSCIKQSKQKER